MPYRFHQSQAFLLRKCTSLFLWKSEMLITTNGREQFMTVQTLLTFSLHLMSELCDQSRLTFLKSSICCGTSCPIACSTRLAWAGGMHAWLKTKLRDKCFINKLALSGWNLWKWTLEEAASEVPTYRLIYDFAMQYCNEAATAAALPFPFPLSLRCEWIFGDISH